MTEQNNDNEQLDEMFASVLGDSVEPPSEIEDINVLVEQEVEATPNVAEEVTNNPLILTNGTWNEFSELSTRLAILDLSEVVEAPVGDHQVIMGERLTYSGRTRVVAADSGCVIPMIQDPTTSSLFSCNTNGDVLNGFIIKQSKDTDVPEGETPETFQHYCFVPFETKARKLIAFSKNDMVYHVSTSKSDEPAENVAYAPSTRSMTDTLTESDRIHIKAKFSKKKLAEDWRTLGHALRDIWSTIHSTLDVNYQRKMLELNKALCYPAD